MIPLTPTHLSSLDQLSCDTADDVKPWEEPYWHEPPKGSPALALVELLQREITRDAGRKHDRPMEADDAR
jgi:hypothetical protein